MRKQLLGAALLLPAIANGGLMTVEYEGMVDAVRACGCESPYAVGDRISGVLTIDTSLAPPDRNPDPRRGDYYILPEPSPDYISDPSRPHPAGGRTADRVIVLDDWHAVTFPAPGDPSWDTWDVGEGRSGLVGDTSLDDFLFIGFFRFSNEGQLFDNDDLVQEIDVTPSDVSQLYGGWERDIGNGLRTISVNFNLSRISLKPGSCPW